jgi:hypothetical protein
MVMKIETTSKTRWPGATPVKVERVVSEDFIMKFATTEELLELNGRRDELNSSQLSALTRALARL